MTLKEACDSGRPFKRVGWPYYYTSQTLYDMSFTSALADDYELEPEPEKTVTITARDLVQAWTRALNSETFPIRLALMEELGL